MIKRKTLLFAPILLVSATILLSTLRPKGHGSSNHRQFENFYFKKIHHLITDSAVYFSAIDSLYEDLPPARARYEALACKRGYFYNIKRDYHTSLRYSDSLLLSLHRLAGFDGYLYWTSKALFYKGDDLYALGRSGESFKYYYKAREAITIAGDSSLFSDFTARLGMVAYKQKRFEEAAVYFKQACNELNLWSLGSDVAITHINFANRQSYLDNVGLSYSKIGKHDSAIKYYDSAMQVVDKKLEEVSKLPAKEKEHVDQNYIESAKAVILGNKANSLIALGDDKNGERMLRESLYINRKVNHANEDVPYCLARLATLHISRGELNKAGLMLNELRELIDSVKKEDLLMDWYRLMADMYEKKGDYKVAYAYKNTATTLRDSIEESAIHLRHSMVERELAFYDNESQVATLLHQKEQTYAYGIAAAVGLILLSALMLLVFRNYRQSREHVAQLQNMNKQLQEKKQHLKATVAELQESYSSNNRLLRIVAHDLRNPIGGIAGISNLMLKGNTLDTSQREMLQMIERSSTHAIELIQDLVHLQTSENDLRKEDIALDELLHDCVHMMKFKADEKNQTITYNCPSVSINADREKIWRVLGNLVGNAIKFSPANSLIAVDASLNENRAHISVSDEGIGIPQDLTSKIFSATGEAKRKGTAGEPSFGLGLSICKQIIEAHNGTIWFESRNQGGTAFRISLPA